jgi:hypothetical protein
MKYIFLLIAILFIQCKPSQKMQASTVKIHAFRLKPRADLRKSIQAYVAEHNIQAGYVITCVGSLTQTHLRYANQPNGTQLNGFFEIVSLVGTVSINGNHLHISLSDSLGKTIGGHLLDDNLVYTTAEIVIGESKNLVFTREKDGTTPWEELQIRN